MLAANDDKLFIHFEIFRILDNYLKAHPDPVARLYLNRIKMNTHAWALGKIGQKWKREYLSRAKTDLGDLSNLEVAEYKSAFGEGEYARLLHLIRPTSFWFIQMGIVGKRLLPVSEP